MTEDDERLSVSRVRSFKGMPCLLHFRLKILADGDCAGIYVCKYRVGYRDNVDLTNVPVAIRDRIVRLEALTGDDTPEFIFALDSAISQSVTHMFVLPSYSEPTLTGGTVYPDSMSRRRRLESGPTLLGDSSSRSSIDECRVTIPRSSSSTRIPSSGSPYRASCREDDSLRSHFLCTVSAFERSRSQNDIAEAQERVRTDM